MAADASMKLCSKCNINKTLDCFSSHYSMRDGLRNECKKCRVSISGEWARNNKEKIAASSKRARIKNPEKFLERQRRDYKNNRLKRRITANAWVDRNREKIMEANRKWQDANKEKYLNSIRNWNIANPGIVLSYKAARRARKIKATPIWADHNLIKDIYAEAVYQGMHVDHAIPLKHKLVCGLHVEHNLQLLTASENLKKHNSFNQEDFDHASCR